MNQPLIPVERVESLLQMEPLVVILALAVGAWLIYKILLRNVSPDRHRNLRGLFKNVAWHILFLGFWAGTYFSLNRLGSETQLPVDRVTAYLGLMTLIQGSIVFVKTCRVLIFEYLFLSHMRVAVPLLLVNLFTLLLTLAISAWMVSEIFSIRLAPLLATSAVFSLVLGLALQDTLGNLFAGIALQIDKPYEMGDWVEIQSGGQKWVGQVHEISWRATVLLGFGDELITVPNRTIAQAQVANYATRQRPVIRTQIFRLPFDAPIDRVKEALYSATRATPGVSPEMQPLVLIAETTESWITYKIIYHITDFGSHFVTGDRVQEACLRRLEEYRLTLAAPRLVLLRGHEA